MITDRIRIPMIPFDKVSNIINAHGFTENQLRAITARGNVIVSAGAGSGKTTVMIARIIDKLLNGAHLDEMLIVTFTRAAAAEMRVKLSEKLSAIVQSQSSADIKAAARSALDTMSVCNIGTLHSYCQKLVKNYFYCVGIDPSAAVCEDGEANLIRRAAVREAVSEAWSAARSDGENGKYFTAMYEMLSTRRNDDGVVDAVSDILEFALSTPSPRGYLGDIKPDSAYFAELDKLTALRRGRLCEKADALKAEFCRAGMEKHVKAVEELNDYLDGRIDDFSLKSYRAKSETDKDLHESFKSLKNDCKKFKSFIAEAEQAKSVNSAPYVKALCDTALAALDKYAAAKAKLAKIDYSDLEHGAYTVLRDGACMAEISRDIGYVFIDEFQDVNPLQSAIADTFENAGAEMFVVGDVKQSIYGFRRCSPVHFTAAIARAENSGGKTSHIALAENFRSAEPVINFVNRVFEPAMTEEFGGVDYRKVGQKLVFGNRSMTDGKAEFVLIDGDGEDDADDETAETAETAARPYSVVAAASVLPHDKEAQFVADSIVAWMDGELKKAEDSGNKYVPSWSNAAVLLRSASAAFCSALAGEFAERGIPFDFGRKSSVKTYPEAVALMDIARCVDNRYDDVALYTALRSPMGGFSDGELYKIATYGERALKESGAEGNGNRGGSRYALIQKVRAYSGEYGQRLNAFFDKLADFSAQSKALDCADLLGYITSVTDYFRYVYTTGGQAQAVEALIDRAAARRCDLHAFLNYYDNADFDLQVDGGGDAVNITTIHSSKGLEYDYVIVADTARKFNERDSRGRVLATEKGVFVKVPDMQKRTLEKSVPYITESMLSPDVTKAEELRLFYVALTRAKRRLTVCGKCGDLKPVEPFEAKRMLDFMGRTTPSQPTVERALLRDETDGILPVDNEIVEVVKNRVKAASEYTPIDLPIKTCVTALARSAAEDDDATSTAPVLTVDEIIEDVEEGKNDGHGGADVRLRGTAYHRAMELVDFVDPDIAALRRDCENYSLVDEREIVRAADVMKELTRGAEFIAKERYFIFNADARKLFGKEGNTLVQGVIDLLAVFGNGDAVIVDYKTGDPAHLKNAAYQMQLDLYAEAVESSTPYKVKRKYLYSFASGKLIEM